MSFNESLPVILKFEGGYQNDPTDPGNQGGKTGTNFGVTQATYDSYRESIRLEKQDVKEISREEVEAIYYRYYKASSADKFDATHPHTALCQFDCAINQGPGTAKFLLQRAINKAWGDLHKIEVDGVIGPKTLAALSSIEDAAILKIYLDLRMERYLHLIKTRPAMTKWQGSWFHRLNKIAKIAELNWSTDRA